MSSTESLRLARTLASAGTLAIVLAAAGASADETDACLAASDSGQKQRDDGHLLEARKQLLLCSRDVCPRLVRSDCEKWAGDVQERMPTVVFGAHDAGGGDLADVAVEVDGSTVATRLDGRPIPVDPGEHRLRFTHEGAAPVEQTVVLREREKGRAVVIEFVAHAAEGVGAQETGAPPAAGTGGGPPIGAYVLGGVGALALGSFAYFGVSGSSDASSLRSTCAPKCSDSSVSDVRRKLLLADISLGVGVVSLGVAGYLLLTAGHHEEPPPAASVSIDFTPVSGGQVATISGRF